MKPFLLDDIPRRPLRLPTMTESWPELKRHAPLALLGTLIYGIIAGMLVMLNMPRPWAVGLFWGLHPLHVLLSAMATTSLYRHWARAGWMRCFLVGYIGAVSIATISDCIIPYLGEWLVALPNRGLHIGFIEKWWLVNPSAILGVAAAWLLPGSTIPHAAHMLLSTGASAFHILMAMGDRISIPAMLVLPIVLYLAVWLPCCSSHIALPMLFRRIADFRLHNRSGGPPVQSERAA